MKHLNEASEWSIWMNEASDWSIRQRQIKHLNEASDQDSMKARRANSLASNIIAPFWNKTLTIGQTLRPARQKHRYTSSENVDVCVWCVGTVCILKKIMQRLGKQKAEQDQKHRCTQGERASDTHTVAALPNGRTARNPEGIEGRESKRTHMYMYKTTWRKLAIRAEARQKRLSHQRHEMGSDRRQKNCKYWNLHAVVMSDCSLIATRNSHAKIHMPNTTN